jgi:hypothetical protein
MKGSGATGCGGAKRLDEGEWNDWCRVKKSGQVRKKVVKVNKKVVIMSCCHLSCHLLFIILAKPLVSYLFSSLAVQQFSCSAIQLFIRSRRSGQLKRSRQFEKSCLVEKSCQVKKSCQVEKICQVAWGSRVTEAGRAERLEQEEQSD